MKRFFSSPIVALLAGACLRLLFVLKFPATGGDTVLYEQLAANWLKLDKLGMDIGGRSSDLDLRMPGYPAFLAIVYAVTGRSGESARMPVMLAQVLVDLAACLVIATLALLLSGLCGPQSRAKSVFVRAWWLAALCPFIANYVAAPLTEVWAVFLTSVAFVLLTMVTAWAVGNTIPLFGRRELEEKDAWKVAALGGFVVGVGTLFRPETPLLLVTTFVALGLWMVRRGKVRHWVLT